MGLAVSAVFAAFAGCGPTEPSVAPPYLAVQRVDDVRLWARASGHIAVEDGCVWLIASGDIRYLPLWPLGSKLTSVGGIDGILFQGVTVPIGSRVALGGGFERRRELVDSLVAEPLREGCESAEYWIVSSVVEINGFPVAPS